ncbi:MAG TPA: hypothetical protein VLC46_23210 [Thermoanaerobaculia bacterium]|jgi:hypothetical protein|nr:hypothetical protein [Thermoanaerobaculia bacterium]
MNEIRGRISRFQYVHVVGAGNTWFVPVFLAFAAGIIYLRSNGEHTSAGYFFLCLVPLATGTGLLSAARRGELDLLFGAGESRSRLWWFALGYAWGVPSLMAIVVMWLCGQWHLADTLLRVVAVLLFTGGVSFSAGLVETRYFAGVLWLLSRFVFVLAPGGMAILRQVESGNSLPKPPALALAVLAAPESATSQHMPLSYLIGAALVGLSALLVSHIWFARADLGGKRS